MWTIIQYSAAAYAIIASAGLLGLGSSFGQNCQCVYLTGTKGQFWGRFSISSKDIRYNTTECVLIFITGADQEIVELRFEEITLRKGCADQLHIFPHIREPVIQDNTVPEETVCSENAYNFFTLKTTTETSSMHPPKENSFNIETNQVENSNQDDNPPPAVTRKNFRIRYRKSIFSSDRVLGMRLVYDRIRSENAFTVIGKFQFIDKIMFRNDGSLMPTTYCDYQFLPRPINYAKEQKPESMWRFFHSPRFPAKYPDHIKCTYKFIGRPRNRVEVLFEEIYLLTGHSSCLRHSDKIIVYDSKVADKSSTIDVLCNEVPSRRVISSGPNLLIEFDASSNRTSNGFSAKYRFLDISQIAMDGAVEDLTNELVASSTTTEQIKSEVTTVSNIASTTKHLRHADSSLKINNGTDTTTEVNASKEHIIQQATSTGRSNSTGVRVCPPGFIVRTNGPDTASAAAAAPSKGSEMASQYRGSNCDKVIYSTKSKNGTIQTPSFPGPYPVRTFCRYELQGQGRERIQIKFFEFSLPSEGDSYDCEEADTLQVFIPIRGRYEPVETLCGDTMPKPIMSNGPRLLLEFRGRHSGKGNRGFKAEYKFLENFGIISGHQLPDTECSFAYNSSDGRGGWFHSPNFPGAYPRNLECNYYFYGEPNDKIFIRFTYFDVEGIFPCETNTASDYVEFSNFMSIDRKFRRLCGKRDGFVVRSDGRFFRITFRTNDRFDKTGFRASYSFEPEIATTESTFAVEPSKSTRNENDFRLTMLTLFCIAYLFRRLDRIL